MGKKIDLMKSLYLNYAVIKELSLSKRQVELINHLKNHKCTSRGVADMYGICVQNASQQLKNLYSKGYLIRVEVEDKTGGYLFEYTALPELFD